MPKISETLRARFREHADEPSHLEAVIVTLAPEGDAGALEAAGMQIEHRMRGQPIVTGRMTATTLDTLSTVKGIVRIEPEGEMRALDDQGP